MLHLQAHTVHQDADGSWKVTRAHDNNDDREDGKTCPPNQLMLKDTTCHCKYPRRCKYRVSKKVRQVIWTCIAILQGCAPWKLDFKVEAVLQELARYVFSTKCCPQDKASSLRQNLVAAWTTKLDAAARQRSKFVYCRIPEANPATLIVHLIRHGHIIKHATKDPDLTPKGVAQVRYLQEQFDRHDHITDILTSPMSRTMSTALQAFVPAMSRGIKVRALPDLQTADDDALSGVGLDPLALAEKYIDHENCLDLLEVDPGWTNKATGKFSRDSGLVEERVARFRDWLKSYGGGSRKKREIVIVTHNSILQELFPGLGPENAAEWTTVTFDDDWKPKETEESIKRREDLKSEESKKRKRSWDKLS